MMKQSPYITIFLISVLFLAGCKKNYVISDRQRILFQYEYINNSRGEQHFGFLIDNTGNVLTYNNPVAWNFPDKDMKLSSVHADENIEGCTNTGKIIPPQELSKFSGYIENIASSKVSALKNSDTDAGTTQFICYLYSESNGEYKGTVIKMEGDHTCENLNFYSKKVTSWMKEISDNISIR